MVLKYFILSLCFAFTIEHQYPQGWDELQSESGWKLIKETKQIKIYSKEISVSPLPAYRGELISDVDKELLIKAAWNVENSLDVFPNAYMVEAGIYNRNGDAGYTAFQIFDIPFLAQRLYQFNSIFLGDSVHWTKTDTIKNLDKMLLPPVNFGSWKVENLGEKSKLTYRLCTDPGGKVPIWIVRKANQHYLPQMLFDLESYAKLN